MFYLENSNKTQNYSLFCMEKGITLIALVVTIVVLLILAGVTINTLTRENGIISKSTEAKFRTELSNINEQKSLSNIDNYVDNNSPNAVSSYFLGNALNKYELQNLSSTLKMEIIFARKNFENVDDEKDTVRLWKQNAYGVKDLLDDEGYLNDSLVNKIYYINKDVAGKDKEYVYDTVTNICYKISKTNIQGYTIHSMEYLQYVAEGIVPSWLKTEKMTVEIATTSTGIKYYEPDFNNFNSNSLIVYYSTDMKDEYMITLSEYLSQNKPKTLNVNGNIFTFCDYKNVSIGNSIWANVKTVSNELNAYWVWIPRYAYKIGNSSTDVIYVDIDNNPLDEITYPNGLPSEYTVHEGFTQEGQELKGIWFSKYAPTQKEIVPTDSSKGAEPKFDNFIDTDTVLIYYPETQSDDNDYQTRTLKEYLELDEGTRNEIYANGKTYYFYKYDKKIWANIKTTSNNLTAWWVWMPRYAYKIESGATSVILVDLDNKPLDKATYGSEIPLGYTVHEGFTQESQELEGVWFSKYSPTDVTEK